MNTNEAFDPAAGTWATGTAVPAAWTHGGAAALGGKVYLVAGSTASGVPSSLHAAFDAGSGSWSSPAALAAPARYAGRAAAVGGKLYVVGGRDPVSASALVDEYDPAVDAWARYSSGAPARTAFGLAVLNGRLYGAGGGTDVAVTSTAWSFDMARARHFSGLQPNTQYSFKAKARNLAGVETGESAVYSTYTWAAVPTASALAMVGGSSLTLSWGVNGNPAGTQFQASLSTGSAFLSETAGAWTADAASATFTGLSASTTYYARVRARNAVGVTTDYGAVLSTRTGVVPPGAISPAPFSGVFVTSLTVNWGSTFSTGTAYTAQLATAADFSGTLFSSSALNLSVTLAGLSANTSYYARVSTSPSGPFTALGSTYTWAAVPSSSAFVMVGVSSLSISWGVNANPAGTQFQASLSTGSAFLSETTGSWTANATSATFTGLFASTTYYARVRARNVVDLQALSVSSTSVTVGWATQGNAGSILYEASRSTSSDFYPAFSGPWSSTPTTTFNNLSSLTTHYFRVRSRNLDGSWNDYSSAISTRTPPRPADFLLSWSQTSGGTYGAGAAAWGDYDGDGLLDFAVSARAPSYGDANKIYHNDGDGSFSTVWVSTQAEESSGVAWGDFDNDGDLDLAYGNAGASEPSVRLYRNDGGGAFSLVWVATETNRNALLRWGDYDNDGRIDLLGINSVYYGTPYAMLFRNMGGGRFSNAWISFEAEPISDAAWGDFDDDGRLDVIAGGGWGSGHARVYRNTGAGFSLIWAATSTACRPGWPPRLHDLGRKLALPVALFPVRRKHVYLDLGSVSEPGQLPCLGGRGRGRRFGRRYPTRRQRRRRSEQGVPQRRGRALRSGLECAGGIRWERERRFGRHGWRRTAGPCRDDLLHVVSQAAGLSELFPGD
ncbi:MAG: VCBS repeat-containing protein [Elusimicrobia bacterium]|nr:VCBS repeat-containing protein [Elusimicrobiota bacterium]